MSFARFIGKTCGFLGYALQYACLTHCTFEYVGDFVMCSGPSMEPTLETNNILLTEHISPRFNRLRRGDIVIAKSPSNPKQNICKRIIALPGDKVRGQFPKRSQVVPRGHVWLEGDNSGNSADSRIYGPVPEGLIRNLANVVMPYTKIEKMVCCAPWFTINCETHEYLEIPTVKQEIERACESYKQRLQKHSNQLTANLLESNKTTRRLKRKRIASI